MSDVCTDQPKPLTNRWTGATLATSAVRGSMWVLASRLVTQAVLLGNGILLARMLSPADFGLIDISTSLALLITVVGEYGLSAEFVQRRTLTRDYLSTAFWTNVAAGVGISILGIVLSPMAAAYFEFQDAKAVLILMSINFLINGFGVAQRAWLVRKLDFGKVARMEMVAMLGFAIVSTVLALAGWGVRSYVIGWLTRTLILTVILFFAVTWKPAWTFHWSLSKEMLGFGGKVMSATSLRYASGNLDRFVLWKGLGSVGLGYYALARRVPTIPITLINAVALKVAFPMLASVQDSRDRLKNGYLRIAHVVALGVFPSMLLFSVLAGPFTRVVFGSQWGVTIFPMRLFALCSCFHAINAPCAPTFQAAGRPDLHLKNQIVRAGLFVLSILVGQRWGINGVAVATMVYTVVVLFFTQFLINQVVDLSLVQVVRVVFPAARNSMLAAMASGAVLVALEALGTSDLVVLLASGVSGGTVYLVASYLWNSGELQELLDLLCRSLGLRGKAV